MTKCHPLRKSSKHAPSWMRAGGAPAWASGTSSQDEQIFPNTDPGSPSQGHRKSLGIILKWAPGCPQMGLHSTRPQMVYPICLKPFLTGVITQNDTTGQLRGDSRGQVCGFICAGMNKQVLSRAQHARGSVPRSWGSRPPWRQKAERPKQGQPRIYRVCNTKEGVGASPPWQGGSGSQKAPEPAGKGRGRLLGSLF